LHQNERFQREKDHAAKERERLYDELNNLKRNANQPAQIQYIPQQPVYQ
jgi:hypothetical protein